MDVSIADAEAYERYIGRWSRIVASEFLAWLAIPAKAFWCDVACGTGALTQAILGACDPQRIDASDADDARIAFARRYTTDGRVAFEIGDATCVAAAPETYDAVVAGLAFPSVRTGDALDEFTRIAKRGGTIAAYVWDFDGEMQLLRYFWDAATELEPGVEESDIERYAICTPDGLRTAWRGAGISQIGVRAIDAGARFRNFDDFWQPFLRGSSPAQTHVRSLDPERRAALRERLRENLPIASDGSIALITRAWAVKGTT